jgi:hypothetical protein
MTALRRAGLGLLTVLLLAVAAAAVGYAARQPTGDDIGAVRVRAAPVAQVAPVVVPAADAVDVPHARATRSQRLPMHRLEPGRVLLARGDTGICRPGSRSSTGSAAAAPGATTTRRPRRSGASRTSARSRSPARWTSGPSTGCAA